MKAHRQGLRTRHQPQRTCVVCRSVQDKRSLTRIVNRGGALQIDPGGKAEGRGAYLCGQTSCWERAARGPALERALSVELVEADRLVLERGKP